MVNKFETSQGMDHLQPQTRSAVVDLIGKLALRMRGHRNYKLGVSDHKMPDNEESGLFANYKPYSVTTIDETQWHAEQRRAVTFGAFETSRNSNKSEEDLTKLIESGKYFVKTT